MRPIFKNISIRAKVFFCIISIMLLPIVVITIIAYRFSEASLMEQIQSRDALAIGHLEIMLDQFLDLVEQHGANIASDPTTVEILKNASDDPFQEVGELKARYVGAVPAVVGFSLFSSSNKPVAESDYNNGQLSIFFSDAFNSGISDTEPYWINYFRLYPNEGDDIPRVIAVTIPVREENELLGHVVVYVETVKMNEFLLSFSQDSYILDSNTKIVAHSSITEQTDTAYTPGFFTVSDIAYSFFIQDSSEITERGNDPVIITTRIYDRANFFLVMVSPFSEVGVNILERLSTIILLCVAMIVLGVVVALVTSRLITKPLIDLKNTMLRMENGLDKRYIPTTTDEIASLGLTFNRLLDNTAELMKKGEEQQEDKRRLQMRLLNEQLKPHFLYNALEMNVSLIDEKMYDMAKKSILSLSRFYRISLSDGNDVISIEKEYEMMNNYLTIQQMRYVEFFDYSISIHPDVFGYDVPKLTLQPIVENAIYHGIKSCDRRNILCIVGYLQNERIYFEVFDDGVGMTAEAVKALYKSIQSKEQSDSFGMSNVMRRLNLFFDEKAEIKIDSEEGRYTNVTISFPIETKTEHRKTIIERD